MGLDIYFYRLKDKKTYDNFVQIRKRFFGFEEVLDKKYYKKQKQENCKKAEEWYKLEQQKLIDGAIDYIDYSKSPYLDISTFYNKEEKEKFDQFKKEFWDVETELGLNDEYIYARKQNWMCAFVENRHPECLVEDKEFGKILEDRECILDRSDIEELVSRMDKVLKSKTEKVSSELLPTMGRFFYGNTEYNEWYYSNIESYKAKFESWLATAEPEECLLYEESW